MPYLSRDQILLASDLKTQEVEVPEWGGTVIVRALNGADRDALEGSVIEMRGKQRVPNMLNFRAKLVALSLVDGDGKRMFTMADVERLGKKSAAALQRVFAVAQTLSGLGENDLEQTEKNLLEGQPGVSLSA